MLNLLAQRGSVVVAFTRSLLGGGIISSSRLVALVFTTLDESVSL